MSMSVETYDRYLIDRSCSVRRDSQVNAALGLGLATGIVAHVWTLSMCRYVLVGQTKSTVLRSIA
jgi:hypothetical protein